MFRLQTAFKCAELTRPRRLSAFTRLLKFCMANKQQVKQRKEQGIDRPVIWTEFQRARHGFRFEI
jgi:hypothetical protein